MSLHNIGLSDALKAIARMRLCEGSERGRWSAQQHLNAAKLLSNCGYEIKTVEQVREFPKIGEGIARKIEEYLETGTLAELNQNTELTCKSDVVGLFSAIPGVGFSTAQKWYDQGYRTQEDIKNAVKSGNIQLNKTQWIGLKYLDEISQKMTREEIEGVAQYIRECLKSIEPHFCLTIVGSYRRGISNSKDVDIVIYPDPQYYDETVGVDGIIEDLLRVMREQTIVFQEGDNNFMGLVEHNMIFRRVDIWVVPISELITTLVGRTAYVETNKKLRLVATKKGYKVSNHGVYKRGGKRIVVKNEQEVFDMFGVEKDYKDNYCL